jgi:hypothetical protein
MQAILRCKRVTIPRISLNVDLTVDENLVLKSPHHYLVKLCKNPLDVSTAGFLSKDSQSSLTRLHIRLACITVIPDISFYVIFLDTCCNLYG